MASSENYTRATKQLAARIGRYARARKFRRNHQELKKLKGLIGRGMESLQSLQPGLRQNQAGDTLWLCAR